jgi:tetratricopeptide (TPR) repeat protein
MIARRLSMLSACVAIATLTASALAQHYVGAQRPATEQEFLALELARVATRPIRMGQADSDARFQLTAEVLNVAATIAGDDPDLLRMMIEAAQWAGDEDLALDGSKRLTRSDPTDLIAQLRVVASFITAMQQTEDRLDAYQRLLGPAGERLDPTVRSRLAFDAAMLYRELGDDERVAELLARALELDSTNKQAAAMAVAFHDARRDRPREQMELLINLLYADPIDSNAIRSIGALLLRHGAYGEAFRFQRTLLQFMREKSSQADERIYRDYVLAAWGSGQVNVALGLIDQLQQMMSQSERGRLLSELQRKNDEAARFNEPFEPIDWNNPPYQDVVVDLPLPLELLRLTIAAGTGKTAMAEASSQRVINLMQAQVEGSESNLGTAGDDRLILETLLADLNALRSELLVMRVLFDDDMAAARALLAKLKESASLLPEAEARYMGWILFREGDPDEALATLENAAPDDPIARLARAAIAEARGDRRSAGRNYAAAWQAEPGTQIGLYAKSRLETLTGFRAPDVSELATDLGRMTAESVPSELILMWVDPAQMVSLRLEPTRKEVQYLSVPVLRVTLRNITPYPLAVGPQSPLSSRLLISGQIELSGRKAETPFVPTIVNLQRRFKLNGREEFSVYVRPSDSRLWEFLDGLPGVNALLTYRGILDYTANDSGQYVPGPMGIGSYADSFVRYGVQPGLRTANGLISRLDSSHGRERLFLLSLATTLIGQPRSVPNALSEEDAEALHLALEERIETMTDLERAWVILRSSSLPDWPERSQIIRRAWDSGGELTLVSMLMTRPPDLLDRRLRDATEHESPWVSAVARTVREVLLLETGEGEAPEPTATTPEK